MELYSSQMTSKSSPTMNHHFDLDHQDQNDFDHLTPADVNSALEKAKPHPNKNPEDSVCYTRHRTSSVRSYTLRTH